MSSGAFRTSILIVDDHPANLVALEAVLESLGQRIIRASSGNEALAVLAGDDIAVVLLDVQMPGMDGFHTASLIRQRERNRTVPIIFLTAGNAEPSAVVRGYTHGAVDFLQKPFDPDVLRMKVAVFVDLFRSQDELRRRDAQLSQQRYSALIDAMPQCVWAMRPDGVVYLANRVWREYSGLSESETSEIAFDRISHPDDRASTAQAWEVSLRTGEPMETQYRIRRASDGSYRWHLARAVPERDASGRIVGWIATATDIDDQKRDEDAQRFMAEASVVLASSLEYETTLAAVARLAVPRIADWCAVDMLDAQGAIQRLAVEHVDAARKQAVLDLSRKYPTDPNSPHGVAEALRTGTASLLTEVTKDWLKAVARNPEHLRMLEDLGIRSVMVVPLIANERPVGAITLIAAGPGRQFEKSHLDFAQDLARRASVAIENARLYADLKEASRLKDEFLSTVSHELRTPLTAILGWTHLLRTAKSVDAARAIATIERNAHAQARIIGDVLDVSRIITGKLRLEVERVDLAVVIREAMDALQLAADAKHIEVAATLDASAAPAMGDPDRLQQVVWNLLANAIKFTPKGGRVEISLDGNESRALIRVRDTGQGIRPDFLPHVFERFRQEDSGATRAHGGLGLGLAIVRHIVDLHGGAVTVHSEGEGRGSTFTVSLPVRAVFPDANSGRASDSAPDGRISGLPPEVLVRLDAVRVLVVDDERDAREMLAILLANQGADVTTAGSMREALEAIAQSRPDVLLSDIGMPGEDGYSLIREVRSRGAEKGFWFPAIALTAYARSEDTSRALSAGFQYHIAKPVEPIALLALVADAAGRPTEPQLLVPR